MASRLNHTKRKWIMHACHRVLPRALNICMPPYFPSNSTVLLRGLNALHIRTNTTSKQPATTTDTDCHHSAAHTLTPLPFSKPFCSTHRTWAEGSGRSGTAPWTLRCAWRTPPRTGLHGWSGWHTAATARPGARAKHVMLRVTCSWAAYQ